MLRARRSRLDTRARVNSIVSTSDSSDSRRCAIYRHCEPPCDYGILEQNQNHYTQRRNRQNAFVLKKNATWPNSPGYTYSEFAQAPEVCLRSVSHNNGFWPSLFSPRGLCLETPRCVEWFYEFPDTTTLETARMKSVIEAGFKSPPGITNA